MFLLHHLPLPPHIHTGAQGGSGPGTRRTRSVSRRTGGEGRGAQTVGA